VAIIIIIIFNFFYAPGSIDPRGYYYYFIFKAHQHKAAGRKTSLHIQNYGCNGNLLCDHGVVERNCISSLQSRGKALEKCIIISQKKLEKLYLFLDWLVLSLFNQQC